ncbi:MAG: acetyl-CoA synthetase [Clostridiales bacterium]|nr:acetyl-CoA synthetase [Clostridiales bacterium]
MSYLYEKYAKATYGEDGQLLDIKLNVPENFNFGFDCVDYLGTTKPEKVAMRWENVAGDMRTYTFKDIMEESARTANYFKSLGIKKGDRVLVILKRHYQFWFTIVALHKIGAIIVPATHQLMTKDIVYRVNAAGITAVVATTDDELADNVDAAQKDSPTLVTKICVNKKREGWEFFDEGIAKQSPVFERPTGDDATYADEPMIMYFTSGTTGYPKIASHSHAYAIGHISTARWWHNVDPDGIHLTVADTGWGKAVWGKLYGQWMCEAAVLVYDYDRFVANDLLNLFAKYKITTFCAPPTIYRFFIKEDLSKYDLSSLKYVTTAGEALNPEVFNKFYEATGVKLMEGFGQTETTLTIANYVGSQPKPGSMGKPSPQYDMCLMDGEGKPVVTGQVGEICINIENGIPYGLFQGYYRDQEKTDEVMYDGYYHTGDMAWRDEDGYFWYVGRTDDVIKSSGYRIGPFEIESVIMELPYVLECAITGVPDPLRGQVVKATIVLVKGKEGTEELKKEIQNYVKHKTAPYKYPRVVEFVTELPKTISGKIRRVELRAKDNK